MCGKHHLIFGTRLGTAELAHVFGLGVAGIALPPADTFHLFIISLLWQAHGEEYGRLVLSNPSMALSRDTRKYYVLKESLRWRLSAGINRFHA
jgi:hypothetical protein